MKKLQVAEAGGTIDALRLSRAAPHYRYQWYGALAGYNLPDIAETNVAQYSPITPASFNYAPVAVAVVLLFAGGWWLISARNWFKGPKVQGTAEELAAIERDLVEVGTAG